MPTLPDPREASYRAQAEIHRMLQPSYNLPNIDGIRERLLEIRDTLRDHSGMCVVCEAPASHRNYCSPCYSDFAD